LPSKIIASSLCSIHARSYVTKISLTRATEFYMSLRFSFQDLFGFFRLADQA
jgi:hypothetical protein